MKKIILFYIIFFTLSYSQTKYLIYFKDKDVAPGNALYKNGVVYNKALSLLTPRCIERRERVMPADRLVTYADIPIKAEYINDIKNLGIKIQNKLRWFNAVSAYLTFQQKSEVLKFQFVKNIAPVKIFYPAPFMPVAKNPQVNYNKTGSLSSDYGPSYPQYELCKIPEVEAKGITGKGVIIGILDDGFIWQQHEALAARKVINQYNFVFHTTSVAPQPGDSPVSGEHGTYVFSILAGYKAGSIIGPAYNSSFILAKTEDDRSESPIEEDNYAAALQWMESQGVDITTSSLGYNIFDDTVKSPIYTYKDINGNTSLITKAINLAFDRGVLTFTAAGNEGNTSWHYVDFPADGFNVLAVGAVYNDNAVAPFSSRGPTYDGRIKPDVVAQGVNVLGANANTTNGYEYADGTSAATPIAAGIGAMLLSAFPYLTNVQAREILRETSGNASSPNNDRGWGLLNAEKAISYPNIDSSSNTYEINKIFISSHGVVPSSAKIHYSNSANNFTSANLIYNDTLKYSFTLPLMPNGTKVYFYFTYNDSLGSNYRDPVTDYYTYKYGNYNIVTGVLNTISSPEKILVTNYPNPFNNSTIINFYSGTAQPAKLIIMNSIGQTVKVLFNGTALPGNNSLAWNGKAADGVMCASGVYYYILHIGGKDYGNKMILLK